MLMLIQVLNNITKPSKAPNLASQTHCPVERSVFFIEIMKHFYCHHWNNREIFTEIIEVTDIILMKLLRWLVFSWFYHQFYQDDQITEIKLLWVNVQWSSAHQHEQRITWIMFHFVNWEICFYKSPEHADCQWNSNNSMQFFNWNFSRIVEW